MKRRRRSIPVSHLQLARLNVPPLEIRAQFARPVFLRAGHEDLAARFAGALQQRQQAAATFAVQFAHHVVNQQHRRELIPKLSPLARLAYRRISHDAEELRIAYEPGVKDDFAVELAQVRDRERRYRTTLIGPHRDDLQLALNEKSAAQFGSEGQKRTLAIALKMAQAEYLTGLHGSAPVLLIDDVMGELDAKRRSGLLPLLERARETSGQVFMTCTEENWPRELGRSVQRWEVKGGTLQKIESGG